MIVHLVVFRLNPDIARDDERVQRFAAAMLELPGKIDLIRDWQHGFNATADADACDYGLRAGFDNGDDLLAYFEHPAHLPLIELWNEIGTMTYCDFEIES